MEYIDLRKVGREGVKQIRSQVIRLKKMCKSGKEIEELVGIRQNRISEIWTAYQREGTSSFERKKNGRKPGSCMLLEVVEQEEVRTAILETKPSDHGIAGELWTLGRVRMYIQDKYHKEVSKRGLSDYMRRWGLSCQRPVKRARRQNSKRI